MRIRNPDGSEAGACGNATRCVADLLIARDRRGASSVIRTIAGRPARPSAGRTGGSRSTWGRPGWTGATSRWRGPMDTLHLELAAGPLADPAAASMGNPHATFFVAGLPTAVDRRGSGRGWSTTRCSPSAPISASPQMLAPDAIRLRVWERGAGLTLACGSGACAALVERASPRADRAARRRCSSMAAGWRSSGATDGHVLMTGPAATSFTAAIDAGALSDEPSRSSPSAAGSTPIESEVMRGHAGRAAPTR